MLTTLAFAIGLALRPVEPDFSVDLFLVANNGKSLENLDWVDKPKEGETIERLLRPILKSLQDRKSGYVVLDGGDCSIFPTGERSAWHGQRTYTIFDSMTESETHNGVTKKRVLARTASEMASWGGLTAQPYRKNAGYVIQHFFYFGDIGDVKRYAVVQDLNSLHTVLTSGTSEDKANLARTMLITGDSVQETQQILRDNNYDFKGICIAKWGLADPSAPNIIAFPPPGLATHYKLSRQNGEWTVRLLEYLRD